ncbi:hypothetical protein M433DRAFT_28311 [Acidomyces richmondensis BFW]|nr:hypothetical protein M433DRAFT_28311 [Acidomyces richmondensis BFW]
MDRAAISRALANAHSPYISLSFIDESLERHVFLANLGSRKWINNAKRRRGFYLRRLNERPPGNIAALGEVPESCQPPGV